MKAKTKEKPILTWMRGLSKKRIRKRDRRQFGFSSDVDRGTIQCLLHQWSHKRLLIFAGVPKVIDMGTVENVGDQRHLIMVSSGVEPGDQLETRDGIGWILKIDNSLATVFHTSLRKGSRYWIARLPKLYWSGELRAHRQAIVFKNFKLELARDEVTSMGVVNSTSTLLVQNHLSTHQPKDS